MKTLSLALTAAAIAATTSSFIATSAEAGRRGGHHRLHFHLHQLQQHQQRQAYRDDDEDHSYRRKKAKQHVVKQHVSKPAEKPVVIAKYTDGQGRQFDLTSKVWFDGKGQCFQGSQPFTFKSGGWSYGDARWIESSAGWGVTSGAAPEAVSCDGIKAFEAKLKPADIKPVAKKVEEPKVQTVQKAELQNNGPEPVTKTVKAAEPAKAECKKYFPSVGELVTVPCGE